MSWSLIAATISFSSGYLPKKCSRVYAPPLALKFWYSPSTHSSMRFFRMPSLSIANKGSQYEPQTTFNTFQPEPLKSDSSSWIILPLPRTGPSKRCKLQLITKIKLSNFSREANEIAPNDSGSSISPSPQNTHTLRSLVSAMPRSCIYFRKRAWYIPWIGPKPIETVGNCQNSGINHGWG